MKLKQTDEDVAVMEKLFDSTMREVLGFSGKYSAAHCVGTRETDEQKDIICAAKARGYQKGLIRKFAYFIRAGLTDSAVYSDEVLDYRERLEL